MRIVGLVGVIEIIMVTVVRVVMVTAGQFHYRHTLVVGILIETTITATCRKYSEE